MRATVPATARRSRQAGRRAAKLYQWVDETKVDVGATVYKFTT